MLNIYDVIAIGVVTIAVIFLVKVILDFLAASASRKAFLKAMEIGIVRPVVTEEMVEKMIEEVEKQNKESTKQ